MANLHSIRSGEGTKRIVFIHGNLASANWWKPTMDALKLDYDMLAVDLRGFGCSPDGENDVTFASHATDIYEMLQHYNFHDFTLVGHSLGGAVAMQFMIEYPHLLTSVVLLNSAPISSLRNVDYNRLEMMVKDKKIMGMALRATMAVPIEEKFFAELLEDCYRAIPAFIPNTRALEKTDFTEKVKGFSKPVLVLHGEKDYVVSALDSKETANTFVQGTLKMIPNVGHNPQVEDTPQFVKELKIFIQSLQ